MRTRAAPSTPAARARTTPRPSSAAVTHGRSAVRRCKRRCWRPSAGRERSFFAAAASTTAALRRPPSPGRRKSSPSASAASRGRPCPADVCVIPLPGSHRRRGAPTWVVACAILVAATISGLGVSALRDRADDARREQLVFERVRALVNEQSSLELEAVVAPAARNRLQRVVEAKRHAIEAALAELPEQAAPPFAGVLAAYQEAVGEELRLLAERRDEAAIDVGERLVDPSLQRLRAALDQAGAESEHEASVTGFQANAGAVAILALAAIFSVLLLRAFQRTRRSLEHAEERAVRESERWFRSLVQEATELIVVVDPDTTVRYLTDSALPLLGHAPENILGKKLIELAHPDDV